MIEQVSWLKRVNWEMAISSIERNYEIERTATTRRQLAETLSLSTFFIDNFTLGIKRLNRAHQLEPFNVLHRYRKVLFFMRFGQWEKADKLVEQLRLILQQNGALIEYLAALIQLRQNQTNRARNISTYLAAEHPNFSPARFLVADIQLRGGRKKYTKTLSELPNGEKNAPLWVDLLGKLILQYPSERQKVAGYVKNYAALEEESPEAKLVQTLLNWSQASLTELIQYLQATVPDSSNEKLVLLFVHERLNERSSKEEAILELGELYSGYTHRKAVRQLYLNHLVELAVSKAAQNDFLTALSVIDRCIRLAPHDPLHQQNRAAIFTLLRERAAYHDAWEYLDRLQYRLALLGRFDSNIVENLLRRHRMFAQQARISHTTTGEAALHVGIFRYDMVIRNEINETILVVNQERINADPDQLRQWMFHRQAELFFSHYGLGLNPNQFLLGVTDRYTAAARLKALQQLSQSLAVLGGEEGKRLANKIISVWQTQLKSQWRPVDTHDNLLTTLQERHIETLSDLIVLCYQWKPRAEDMELVNELLRFVSTEVYFLIESELYRQKTDDPTKIDNTALLRNRIRRITGSNLEAPCLLLADRAQLAEQCKADLLLSLSISVYESADGTPKEGARRALGVLNRARQVVADNPVLEYFAARYFFIGGFHDEARAAIISFYRCNDDSESRLVADIEQIQQALAEVEPETSRPYMISREPDMFTSVTDQMLDELLAEVDAHPNAYSTYEKLIYALIARGERGRASDYAEQALARCLSRSGQKKGRLLHIEVLAYEALDLSYEKEVHLNLRQMQKPLIKVLEKVIQEEDCAYPHYYLLGKCQLADGEPDKARKQFETALEKCNRQLHYGVLREVARDVEGALVEMLRDDVKLKVKANKFNDAANVLGEVWTKMQQPERLLVDLAEFFLAAILAGERHGLLFSKQPQSSMDITWSHTISEIFQMSDRLSAAKALVDLALKVVPAAEKRIVKIKNQLEQLEDELLIADALERSSQLFQQQAWQAAIEVLTALSEKAQNHPAILRQKLILLLKARRFSEADQLAIKLQTESSPSIIEFLRSYPKLRFSEQIQAIQKMLGQGEWQTALESISLLEPKSDKETLDAIYFKAFALAARGYHQKTQGLIDETVQSMNLALDELEPLIPSAQHHNYQQFTALYEKLTQDIEQFMA